MEITSTPRISFSIAEYVPFPEPGAPKIIAFIKRVSSYAWLQYGYENLVLLKLKVVMHANWKTAAKGNVYGCSMRTLLETQKAE
jgi:hypothetical protein